MQQRNEHFPAMMTELGFHKIGKDWVHDALGLSIGLPSEDLVGDIEKVLELTIANRTLYIIGVEDLILERLRAAVHWKSSVDAEWGYRLTRTYLAELDVAYLRTQVASVANERQELENWLEG